MKEKSGNRTLEEMLYGAIYLGRMDLVEEVLGSGIDVDMILPSARTTALIMACRFGDSAIAKLLIECGADTEIADKNDLRPINLAARSGNAGLVKFLLDHGSDSNSGICVGITTPLSEACHVGAADVITVLLDHDALLAKEGDDSYGVELIGSALCSGDIKTIELVLSLDIDVMKPEACGLYPIHRAAQCGSIDVLSAVCKKGADINQRAGSFYNGETPIHLAVSAKDDRMVKALIVLGASIDAVDEEGETALYRAVISREKKMIGLLIKFGADPDIENNDRNSARGIEPELIESVIIRSDDARERRSSEDSMGL